MDNFNLEDFTTGSYPTSERMMKAQELTHLTQEIVRRRFMAVEQEFQDLVMSGLLVPESIRVLFEMALIQEVHALHARVEGNIDKAIALAREEVGE